MATTSSSSTVLHTRAFFQVFKQQFTRGPIKLTIVSPFIDELPVWDSISNFVKFAFTQGLKQFTLVTRPPNNSPSTIDEPIAELLITMGVDVKIRTARLHSKVYYFEFEDNVYSAFIGSANFTRGGLERNEESMVWLSSRHNQSTVLSDVKRLSGYGAFPYDHWKRDTAREKSLEIIKNAGIN